jgi:excinuclease ABC subunit A
MSKSIIVKGARQNNLKNVDVIIPRDQLVVFTGLSGSGKSSLAIDTIYAEGQRRYLESLNTYARQFLGSMDKPDVDYIEGLSPAIAIEQKAVSQNPRSTVGTVTEIFDYLRLLYANIGIPHCPTCNREIMPQTTQEITEKIIHDMVDDAKFRVLAPIIQRRKGEYSAIFKQLKKEGFVRVIVDELEYELDEEIKLDKNKFHDIDVVIDRLVMKHTSDFHKRLADAIEQASHIAKGLVKIWEVDKPAVIFSESLFCPECGISLPEIRPQLFSFNTPLGFCPTCNGLGTLLQFTEDRLFPDKTKSIYDSNLRNVGGFGALNSYTWTLIENVAEHYKQDISVPIDDLPADFWNILLYGSGSEKIAFSLSGSEEDGDRKDFSYNFTRPFEGIISTLQRRYVQTTSESSREYYEMWMSEIRCQVCKGQRLRPEALAVTVDTLNIAKFSELPVETAIKRLQSIESRLNDRQKQIIKEVLKELYSRYNFLLNVGLDYITMDRQSRTLSGGESERVRLATQIGSNLVGVLYVLDEPSIGLHPRDKYKLIKMLEQLRDKGNTILVVEHDEDIIRAADHIIDIGPGAGIHGGNVIAQGKIEQIEASPQSLTGQYLKGERFIPIPTERRTPKDWIRIIGAREHNLKNTSVKIPLGVLTVVTGVSGAGKSSLIMEILYKGLQKQLNPDFRDLPGDYDLIEGLEKIDKIIHVDQQPIGRTPRSIPATYTKVFDRIRDLFEELPESKLRGYKKGRFSFNVKGGRCEKCQGSGFILIEMQFLPDVFIRCDVCKGQRYNQETLEVKFKGKNIAEILKMSHEEAYNFFENFPKMQETLKTMMDVGLGYIELGQSSTTLSGGEAQRIKLSRELSKRSTGSTIYILDEPTTGLHFHDTLHLIEVIQRLVDQGNTVLIIEHNLDVIKSADYVIDMGPEGGDQGGYLICEGTPEEIILSDYSHTAKFLKPIIEKESKIAIPVELKSQINSQYCNSNEKLAKNGNQTQSKEKNTVPDKSNESMQSTKKNSKGNKKK